MPLGRYFAITGCVLLALLFLIDWYLPPPAARPAGAAFDRSIIRIQSKERWPSPVVFDTTQPTIAPPPSLITATAPAPPATSARQAFAYAPPLPASVVASPAPPKQRARRTRVARAPAIGVANSDTGFREVFFREAFPPSW
ncbi:MAG TPA: hypothetical protein VJS63_09755 [Bradyrhizobium sp.]|nr:hypothetical protein [Bradyrhizobium sp.]